MGKGRRRRNKKKRGKLYRKKQFAQIFCQKCNMCKDSPTFCYDDVYRLNPILFIKPIFNRLLEVKEWDQDKSLNIPIDVAKFRYAFCTSLAESCGVTMFTGTCSHMTSCYDAFSNQVNGAAPSNVRVRKKKEKKEPKRYICKPYPTLFMSDNDKWINFIKGLFNGDSDIKQDKVEESPEGIDKLPNKRTEDSES